jgi:hypothetical protein
MQLFYILTANLRFAFVLTGSGEVVRNLNAQPISGVPPEAKDPCQPTKQGEVLQ